MSWYINGQQVPGRASSSEDADRTGTGRSELALTVGRKQLGAQLECKADNEAVPSPLISAIQLDVSLRPQAVKIGGAEAAVEAGDVVSLLCSASGARPAAVLTWYNGTSLFQEQPAGQVSLQPDGTYKTESRLSFIATRWALHLSRAPHFHLHPGLKTMGASSVRDRMMFWNSTKRNQSVLIQGCRWALPLYLNPLVHLSHLSAGSVFPCGRNPTPQHHGQHYGSGGLAWSSKSHNFPLRSSFSAATRRTQVPCTVSSGTIMAR